jgi:hypothetical protein
LLLFNDLNGTENSADDQTKGNDFLPVHKFHRTLARYLYAIRQWYNKEKILEFEEIRTKFYRAEDRVKIFESIDVSNNSIKDGFDLDIKIYPNPTSGFVHIDGIDAAAKVSVFSLSGRLVERGQSNSIDLSTQPAEVYLLRVGNKTTWVVKK